MDTNVPCKYTEYLSRQLLRLLQIGPISRMVSLLLKQIAPWYLLQFYEYMCFLYYLLPLYWNTLGGLHAPYLILPVLSLQTFIANNWLFYDTVKIQNLYSTSKLYQESNDFQLQRVCRLKYNWRMTLQAIECDNTNSFIW